MTAQQGGTDHACVFAPQYDDRIAMNGDLACCCEVFLGARYGFRLQEGMSSPDLKLSIPAFDLGFSCTAQVDTVALPEKDNKWGMSFMKQETDLTNEAKAARVVDPTKARFWKIKNPSKKHVYSGEPTFVVPPPLVCFAFKTARGYPTLSFTRSAFHGGLCPPSCSMCRAAKRIAPYLAGAPLLRHLISDSRFS